MNICVCGWYGREYDAFYMTLYKVNKRHPVMVVAKQSDSFWDEMGLEYTVIDNVGLEWSAYNYYLKHIWKRSGDTLFIHDDIVLYPILKDNDIIDPEILFDRLAEIQYDQAYIFGSRAEDVFNLGCHGRAIYISAGLMEWLYRRNIWFDEYNTGYTGGKKPDGPFPCKHYNAGTEAFRDQMKLAKQDGYNVLNKVYVPAFRLAHRGEIKNWEEMV